MYGALAPYLAALVRYFSFDGRIEALTRNARARGRWRSTPTCRGGRAKCSSPSARAPGRLRSCPSTLAPSRLSPPSRPSTLGPTPTPNGPTPQPLLRPSPATSNLQRLPRIKSSPPTPYVAPPPHCHVAASLTLLGIQKPAAKPAAKPDADAAAAANATAKPEEAKRKQDAAGAAETDKPAKPAKAPKKEDDSKKVRVVISRLPCT